MSFLDKGDNVESGIKANARHRRLRPVQGSIERLERLSMTFMAIFRLSSAVCTVE